MKRAFVSFAAILFLSLVQGNNVQRSIFEYEEGQRDPYYFDDNGIPQLHDAEQYDTTPPFTPSEDVIFFLYTRENPLEAQEIVYENGTTLTTTNFDKTKAVKLLVHGYHDNGAGNMSKVLVEAFLDVLDVNVVFVDWSVASSGTYPDAYHYVINAGLFLGKMIDWLVGEGVSLDNIHLIGFCLGAHVVGIAGRSATVGSIPYITGLDPTYPLWSDQSQRLRPSDAAYVEVIHCNMGQWGLFDPVGDNDFYPNGGLEQPGCGYLQFTCSHVRCYEIFADSLDHTGFQAVQCTDYDEMFNSNCKNLSTLYMGGSTPKPGVGIFYLETNSEKPFYQG